MPVTPNPNGDLPNILSGEFNTIKQEILNDPTGIGYPAWPSDQSQKESVARDIANKLTHRKLIDNPNPQQQILKPLDKDALFSMISSNVGSFSDQALIRVSEAVDNQDRHTLGLWMQIALTRGWIDQTMYDNLSAEVSSTIPDPNYKSQILGDNRLTDILGRHVGGVSPEEIMYIMEN